MALTKCRECGRQISTKAEACPGCGAKQPRRTSALTWLVAGIALFLLIAGLLSPDSPPSSKSDAAVVAKKSPEEQRRDRNLQRAVVSVKALREAMRNPESFALEQALAMDTGTLCFSYRAQNGFGGMNRERAVLSADDQQFTNSSMDGFSRSWNARCAGKQGEDITRLVNVYL